MNNKGCFGIGTIGLVILLIVAAIGIWAFSAYNGLVAGNNEVQKKWANVESVYQKRANLIPNLANTVKAYAKHEQETLTKVIEARANATSVKIDPTNMTEADMAKFQAAQGELSGALSKLMMVVESYPNLKADQQFIDFQREYTAVENSLRTETVNYNDSVEKFNNSAQQLPGSLLVAFFPKFAAKPVFKADAGAQKAPEVFKEE